MATRGGRFDLWVQAAWQQQHQQHRGISHSLHIPCPAVDKTSYAGTLLSGAERESASRHVLDRQARCSFRFKIQQKIAQGIG